MAAPQGCAPALYDIMLECWHKVGYQTFYQFDVDHFFNKLDVNAYLFQDPMKRPTFETLQWKLEDFFTMSDSEYKEASAY